MEPVACQNGGGAQHLLSDPQAGPQSVTMELPTIQAGGGVVYFVTLNVGIIVNIGVVK